MADQDAQDRNLPASQRKLDKAREDGQVARSRDLGHFAAIAAGGAALVVMAPTLADLLSQIRARVILQIHTIEQDLADALDYAELADAIRTRSPQPTQDVQQLWRRMVFNLLITNVDDHLQNHGFLHVAHGQWRLAPAFDLNPFPDKDRESKTWLSEQDGPITDVAMLLATSPAL